MKQKIQKMMNCFSRPIILSMTVENRVPLREKFISSNFYEFWGQLLLSRRSNPRSIEKE